MSESEDKNEHESDTNDPQTFASLVSKDVVDPTIGEALDIATQQTKIVLTNRMMMMMMITALTQHRRR